MINKSKKTLISWASLKIINVYINQNKILSNININLNYGENILILGPNGSGKSTLLKLFNRSVYPITSNQSSFKLFNKENINILGFKEKGWIFIQGNGAKGK